MKKTLTIILLLLSINFLYSQRIAYHSNIYDGVTYYPIEGANIYNTNTNEYVFSDKKGHFVIKAGVNDTIIISKSIYRQIIVILDPVIMGRGGEDFLMYYKAILLKEVKVMALNPSYEGFKRDLSKIQYPDIYQHVEGTAITEWDKANADYNNGSGNILRNTPMASPITYLYETFSKKAQMKRLYYEMLEYEEEIDKVPAKYNKQLVSELTGLTDESLMEFMVYCRFSYYDLIKWTPQEVIAAIKYRYNEYEYYKQNGR